MGSDTLISNRKQNPGKEVLASTGCAKFILMDRGFIVYFFIS